MSLGAAEYETYGGGRFLHKKSALVMAFEQVMLKTGQVAPSTKIIFPTFHSNKAENGDIGPENDYTIVPFSYEEVRGLLAESSKTGIPVDFIKANQANLRHKLGAPSPG